MSKLQELIDQYCPNGVPFKKLDEILDYEQPTQYIVKSTKYDDSYKTPVLTAGQTFILGYTNEDCGIYKADKIAPTIIFDDFTTSFHWVDFDFKVKSSAMKMLRPKSTFDGSFRYVFYAMECINFEAVNHTRHWISKYSQFEIPLPPPPIQEEIVKILDRFAEYAAELQAELQARQEQYEYFRNKLLTFNEIGGGTQRIIWMKMSEAYDIKAGKSILSSMIEKEKTLNNPYPCYGGNGLRGYVSEYNQQGDKILIGRQGALCGNICFANNKFYATEHAVVVSDKGYCIPRYTYHLLTKMDLNQYKTAGAQPGLSVSRLEKLLIPIPPMEIQYSIANVLDKYETLVSDLAQGLPAEIAAVQEQYEYYRDKLLSFSEYKLSA